MMTSPPRPPSPPEGPPRGTNFSRRKATHPLPPSPALTRILASSMNIVLVAARQTAQRYQQPSFVQASLSSAARRPHGPRRVSEVAIVKDEASRKCEACTSGAKAQFFLMLSQDLRPGLSSSRPYGAERSCCQLSMPALRSRRRSPSKNGFQSRYEIIRRVGLPRPAARNVNNKPPTDSACSAVKSVGLGSGRRFDHYELALAAAVHEFDHAADFGKQGIVFAAADVQPGLDAGAALANDDSAAGHKLPAESLDSQPLRIRIAAVP